MVLKKTTTLLFACAFILSFLSSCVNDNSGKTETYREEEAKPVPSGEALFIMHCESCHGMDGTKGYSGAADLAQSKLSDQKVEHTILYGNDKGMMPYEDLIQSDEQLKSLVDFVKKLRK